jgi:hypothetical protein
MDTRDQVRQEATTSMVVPAFQQAPRSSTSPANLARIASGQTAGLSTEREWILAGCAVVPEQMKVSQ